jgi:hypothetical protein
MFFSMSRISFFNHRFSSQHRLHPALGFLAEAYTYGSFLRLHARAELVIRRILLENINSFLLLLQGFLPQHVLLHVAHLAPINITAPQRRSESRFQFAVASPYRSSSVKFPKRILCVFFFLDILFFSPVQFLSFEFHAKGNTRNARAL